MPNSLLENALVVGVAAFFLYVGVRGLADPSGTLSYFSAGTLGPDMRNEVRAVYGGYGIAVGCLLVTTIWLSSIKTGARAGVLVSVGGMAAGRTVSFAMESAEGGFPLLILIVELVLVVMLAGAVVLQERQAIPS